MSVQLQTYVSMRLERCGRWARSGGFPGPQRVRSWWGPMVLDRNVKRTADPERQIPVDATEAEQTYYCVLALGDPNLIDVVIEAYFKGGTVDQKCRALHCCKQTYYNRLERAQTELIGYMNDAAAGLPLPRHRKQTKEMLTPLDSFSTFLPIVA